MRRLTARAIEIVYVDTLDEVLKRVLVSSPKKTSLVDKLAKILPAAVKNPIAEGASAVGSPNLS